MGRERMHRVVIVGGGFGGLQATLKLRRAPAQITLVDRRNFHLFQPLESALMARGRILSAFEAAEMEPDPERRAGWLTFAIVGGGPTGVEMAGQIAELARDTLTRDFRSVDPRTGRILLIEASDRVL